MLEGGLNQELCGAILSCPQIQFRTILFYAIMRGLISLVNIGFTGAKLIAQDVYIFFFKNAF